MPRHDDQPSPGKRLFFLRQKLARLGQAWTVDDYNKLLYFYMINVPKVTDVERCAIFISDPENNRIFSMFATGITGRKIEPPLSGSVVGEVIRSNRTIIINDLDNRDGYHLLMDQQTGFTSRNTLCVPIRSLTDKRVIGAIQLLNKTGSLPFGHQDQLLLEEIAGYLTMTTEAILLNGEILQVADTINRDAEHAQHDRFPGTQFIAKSRAMTEVLKLVDTVAPLDINILIQGENGTGKELIARMIHQQSPRADNPFLPVNCACIPENLIESEFFGHEKGAFTDASACRKGRFEEARGGTLFLDEIGDMALHLQPKFLRAIQESEGSRLGSDTTVEYDVRLISASNKDLSREVSRGTFREDLFFRIFSVEIEIPPLRKRRDDILPLALAFLAETSTRFHKNIEGFSTKTIQLFESFPWPGNVRQLKKEIERLVALTREAELITPDKCSRDLLGHMSANQPQPRLDKIDAFSIPDRVRQLETALIKKALAATSNNKSRAAEFLHISRQGLFKKMKRYGIS